jgi:hypothetical protein
MIPSSILRFYYAIKGYCMNIDEYYLHSQTCAIFYSAWDNIHQYSPIFTNICAISLYYTRIGMDGSLKIQ